MREPVLPTLLHRLRLHRGIEPGHRLEADIDAVAVRIEIELHLEMKIHGLIGRPRHSLWFYGPLCYGASVMVKPSCTSSIDSIATSLASAFRSVAWIFVGQALARLHVMIGLCCSSISWMITFVRYLPFTSWKK